jgi:GNAT superfamily N-acetyltransferase
MAVARVHVRAWQSAYRELLPGDYLDGLRPEDRAPSYDFANQDPLRPFTIVADSAGLIQGFATTMPVRDEDLPGYGELCALHVDPDIWGQGCGRSLMAAARAHLWEQGFHHASLWVLAGNERAERFYRINGWEPDGCRRWDTVWGVTVDEVRYRCRLEA